MFCHYFLLKGQSWYRLCPYEHLNRMVGQDQETACGPLHRPSRSKKSIGIFWLFQALGYVPTVSFPGFWQPICSQRNA